MSETIPATESHHLMGHSCSRQGCIDVAAKTQVPIDGFSHHQSRKLVVLGHEPNGEDTEKSSVAHALRAAAPT